jgi:hypothetical protein
MDRRRLGAIGITDFYRRMRRSGFTQGQADTIYSEFVNLELIIEIKLEAPFTRCEVVKYFAVVVRNPRKTPPIRFELRTQLTIPTELVTRGEDESESEWHGRLKTFLDDKVEPIMDEAFEVWGNQERVTVNRLTGQTERWQNVLNLDDFRATLPVTGVEIFEGKMSFEGSLSIGLTKYASDGSIMLTDEIRTNVSEDDFR